MHIKSLAYTNEVRLHRERAGLTQVQLGELVGVSDNTICSIENGSGCSIKIALKLSLALSVPVFVLFRLVDLSTGSIVCVCSSDLPDPFADFEWVSE